MLAAKYTTASLQYFLNSLQVHHFKLITYGPLASRWHHSTRLVITFRAEERPDDKVGHIFPVDGAADVSILRQHPSVCARLVFQAPRPHDCPGHFVPQLLRNTASCYINATALQGRLLHIKTDETGLSSVKYILQVQSLFMKITG